MNTKYLGFLGVKHYDIIYYLSRVYTVLGNKVLIVDVSPNKSYMLTVPNLANDCNIFDYRGVDITEKPSSEELNYDLYNYVLVDFGTDMTHKALPQMDEIYMVTDLQLDNAELFNELVLQDYQERFLVIRDIIRGNKLDKIIVDCFLDKSIREGSIFPIESDQTDTELSLECMYKDTFNFGRLSREMYYFLYSILSVEYEEKVFRTAFKRAAGGK